MATYYKKTLSSSTDGKGVLVAATTSPGTTIHTGSSSSTTIQEIWLYASNPDSYSHLLTIQWGGTTSPDDYITMAIPAYSGLTLICAGNVIKGNSTPLVIKAFADTASKVSLHGYVNEVA